MQSGLGLPLTINFIIISSADYFQNQLINCLGYKTSKNFEKNIMSYKKKSSESLHFKIWIQQMFVILIVAD